MVKILIADDHPVVRAGLKQILSEMPEAQVVGEARSSQELMGLVWEEHWDIVVLDITMPGRGGLDVLKDLRKEHPRLPVLILSMHPEDQYGIRALRAGAAGYMTKESAPENLVWAIRKIRSGGKYISPQLAEKLAGRPELEGAKRPHEGLSDREYQVLSMISSGKTVSRIADELALSVKTISTYRSRLLEKMAMKSNAELTHYAFKNGLIE